MSIEAVRTYFAGFGKDKDIREFEVSSATVELAAQAVSVEPARIAKTLSFVNGDGCLLIVTAGDARIYNGAFKHEFGMKATMLPPDRALELTGHAIGGVCPFALRSPGILVVLDISLRRFDTVFPACGSSNSAIELTCDELFELSGADRWVDVCKDWLRPDPSETI